MIAVEQLQTRMSLLIRLARPGTTDETAWREFVTIYTPLIFRWCCNHGLQESDAEDVTQQVLLKLAAILPTFQYDPTRSFRAWLSTVTHHAWVDFHRGRDDVISGDSAARLLLSSIEARQDLIQEIEAEFDLERCEQAMEAVRSRVEPGTWEAFRRTALEGVPAADVAKDLGKQVATIYVSRSNVQKMLQQELAKTAAADLDS
ncbi:sigma-70 family RNA polymerase sigma factor [soil metagenome]